MRHRDDDIERFRASPVVQALTAPATEAELAGEAEAVTAFRGSMQVVPKQRSTARVAATATGVVVALALAGGVGAAYGRLYPDKWQQKLHDRLHSIGIPAPKQAAPTPVQAAGSTPPAAVSSAPTPTITPTLPVAVPSVTATTAVPTPTVSTTQPPTTASGALTIALSATHVAVGQGVQVVGKLAPTDGSSAANREVTLLERVAGRPDWQRVGNAARTSAGGKVSFTVPGLERNVQLQLRAGPGVQSAAAKVVVIPMIHIVVAATNAGATSTTVTVTVNGGEAGDVVVVRTPGQSTGGQHGELGSTLSATFSVPVSQTQALHYELFVPSTTNHGAHSLAFYVPASG